MCPPPAILRPLSEIGLYWSDEQLIGLLADYTPGYHLPADVITDSNPYECLPYNLPEGIWYLVHPNLKRESIYGFWKAKNEPCMVVSNSMITGWRTTLEYFNGNPPHGQITDWLMQEYSIKQKGLCGKDKPEVSRLLCRVFLCSGHSSKSEMNGKTSVDSKQIAAVTSIDPNINITFGEKSRTKSQATWASEVGAVTKPGDEKSNSSPSIFSEQECFLNGDFLEMDDLDSNFTSSQNSSCPSNLSDDCFDASALKHDIEESETQINQTQSSSTYNFSSSVRPNDIILQHCASVMSRRIELMDGPQTALTIPEGPISDTRIASGSTPSSSCKSTSEACSPKKPGSDRIKKLKFYFCFKPF